MIIEPMRDKKGRILTNVELIKIFYNKLNNLKNGVGATNQAQKDALEDKFYKICGGSSNAKELMSFMEQIVNEPDVDRAQKLFARALIPVEFKKI